MSELARSWIAPSSLSGAWLKEAPGAPLDDVVEVTNYARAMEHGLDSVPVDEG